MTIKIRRIDPSRYHIRRIHRDTSLERAWYATQNDIILGGIVLDPIDHDFGWIVLRNNVWDQGPGYTCVDAKSSYASEALATSALHAAMREEHLKKPDEPPDKRGLLIDRLYKQTFKKPPMRNDALRAVLTNARRFVLDDAMAAFLADMHYQFFTSIYGRSTEITPRKLRRLHRRIDEVRYFSRLPHAVTWIEWSRYALMTRNREILDHSGYRIPSNLGLSDDDIESSRYERIGWLMRQHDKIENAFTCTKFESREDRGGLVYHNPAEFVWVTDDTPSPWRLTKLDGTYTQAGVTYNYASELATSTPLYIHDNVGWRPLYDDEPDMQRAMHEQLGVMNWFWIFLSTLNKIPHTKVTQIVRSHGFVARGSYRKFLDHEIITLHIPDTQQHKIARATVTEVMRRRAHMVRGHWRDDSTLPKGNKSIWIAEHQRGDASLGFVVHDYSVEHETK